MTTVRQIIDTSKIHEINPSWPRQIVTTHVAVIRGEKKAIWIDGKLCGFLGHQGWEVFSID